MLARNSIWPGLRLKSSAMRSYSYKAKLHVLIDSLAPTKEFLPSFAEAVGGLPVGQAQLSEASNLKKMQEAAKTLVTISPQHMPHTCANLADMLLNAAKQTCKYILSYSNPAPLLSIAQELLCECVLVWDTDETLSLMTNEMGYALA